MKCYDGNPSAVTAPRSYADRVAVRVFASARCHWDDRVYDAGEEIDVTGYNAHKLRLLIEHLPVEIVSDASEAGPEGTALAFSMAFGA